MLWKWTIMKWRSHPLAYFCWGKKRENGTLLKKIRFQLLLKDIDKQGKIAALCLDISVKGKNCDVPSDYNRSKQLKLSNHLHLFVNVFLLCKTSVFKNSVYSLYMLKLLSVPSPLFDHLWPCTFLLHALTSL